MALSGACRFRPEERVRRQRDFDRVYAEGGTVRLPGLILRVRANELGWSRLGLSVGRRVGNAVARNRVKRLLREAWRLNKSRLRTPCDVVAIPRDGAIRWRFADVERLLRRGLDEAGRALDGG